MVPFSLSVSDLLMIPKFQKAFGEDDKETIKKVLYENGMEVDLGIDEVFCTHRNLQGKVVSCMRYEGGERTCESWLASGAASLDAHIASCPDYTRRVHLNMMCKTSDSKATDDMLERAAHTEARKVATNVKED